MPFANKLARGLTRKGIPVQATKSQERIGGIPFLLGTTFFREIESDGGEYILVDRCHYGATDDYVSFARNGRGYRAQWPDIKDPSRWEKHSQELMPWRTGKRIVLCGQVGSYSPDWMDETNWYGSIADKCTHFRPHPRGDNPTKLPLSEGWDDVKCAVVLNSSVAVQTVMCGIPTVTMDKGSMAWPITGHSLDDIRTPEREEWCHWLAWCQWSHDEITEGLPWDYLSL